MVSFPYHSHIFRDSYGSGMGIVWEASHKRVPLLGVPGITLDTNKALSRFYIRGECCDAFSEIGRNKPKKNLWM